MTTKHILRGAWLLGTGVSAILIFGGIPGWSAMPPFALLQFVLFWPHLVLEAVGSNACVHACAGLTAFLDEGLPELLPASLLDTLTFLIACAVVARLIIRSRRPKRRTLW